MEFYFQRVEVMLRKIIRGKFGLTKRNRRRALRVGSFFEGKTPRPKKSTAEKHTERGFKKRFQRILSVGKVHDTA